MNARAKEVRAKGSRSPVEIRLKKLENGLTSVRELLEY
jgi:hypothetical protein